MAIHAFTANSMQYELPRELECSHCEFCTYPHDTGVFCECGNSVCRNCLKFVKHAKLLERLECCSHCLESRVLALLDAVDAMEDFVRAPAAEIGAELLASRRLA